MFAMLTGKPPFECATVQDTLMRIKSGKFEMPGEFSTEVKDLIGRLLTTDPKLRMSVKDVLAHPFIIKYAPSTAEEADQD